MDRGDHFNVVGQKIWPIQTETLRPVFRHLSCIRAPSGALEKITLPGTAENLMWWD